MRIETLNSPHNAGLTDLHVILPKTETSIIYKLF